MKIKIEDFCEKKLRFTRQHTTVNIIVGTSSILTINRIDNIFHVRVNYPFFFQIGREDKLFRKRTHILLSFVIACNVDK